MHEILLLVLILFSDPTTEPAAKALRDDLVLRGGPGVVVLIGPEAFKKLESLGIRDGDLVGTPRLGEHLTDQDRKIVLVHLDNRDAGGDRMIDSRVWAAGRCDRHTAIAGKGADPGPAMVAGVVGILAPLMPTAALTGAGAGTTGTGDLPLQIQRQDWNGVVARLAAKPNKDAREFYYLVMAQARLRDPAAAATVVAMEKAFPGHFLIAAAKGQLPAEPIPERAPIAEPTTVPTPAPAK